MSAAGDTATLRYLGDRVAVVDVLTKYWTSIDRRDFQRLRTCFTDDVEAVYGGVPVAGGLDALMDYLTGKSSHDLPVDLENLEYSMHFIGTHEVSIEGDAASSETYALAHIIDRPATGRRMRRRGLRYVDELRRGPDGDWLLSRREMFVDWMTSETLI